MRFGAPSIINNLPDFGKVLAIDSKAINSLAHGFSAAKASTSDVKEGHALNDQLAVEASEHSEKM